ncbi:MAG: DUF2252 family protein [Polaromonas sp.]|uniref:DUF2252 domain-containing protein n=1 Tax=Polaromonas sp. TaxID=1869339 RepID=UPI001801F067|nr:DUF2252 family protein [Polaromonas sp.]NMM09581.1 DUF2252 family protein [Polaromonas sp.]
MHAVSLIDSIRHSNAGRDPQLLAMKYAKMKASPFVFLRGACQLFYAALPEESALTKAPLSWSCGDMHFENFGSYKADNRLVYFDINDFDEAALAPCTWDIVRLLTSIQCGAKALSATAAEALAVSRDCLTSYQAALIRGKPLWVEPETSSGLVRDLFVTLQKRVRSEFLDGRTVRKNGQRQLKIDGVKALSVDAIQRDKVIEFMTRFAAEQPNPGFFKVLDVARRIAGTGSLGVQRYVILVEGKGSPDRNYLLDLKEAKPSALQDRLKRCGIHQPAWPDEASRVVTVQKRMQSVDHAFLFPVLFEGLPCVLKGLQPSEDRVAIGDWGKKINQLREVVSTMGRILAWDQLRAAGRGGAANAGELIDFAQAGTWIPAVLEISREMTKTTQSQWEAFRDAAL